MDCAKRKNCLIVNLSGEIDHHQVETIKSTIDEKYELLRAKNIVFDFTEVTFMDSSGIGLIYGRYKNTLPLNGQVSIVNAPEKVKRILTISGIFKMMDYYDNTATAIRAMN